MTLALESFKPAIFGLWNFLNKPYFNSKILIQAKSKFFHILNLHTRILTFLTSPLEWGWNFSSFQERKSYHKTDGVIILFSVMSSQKFICDCFWKVKICKSAMALIWIWIIFKLKTQQACLDHHWSWMKWLS